MTHSELKKLQDLQYEILKYVDSLCKKYDIEYFLIYGTLLGAVRHKGTIPWDYDIDIAMTRENHNKFVKIAKENPEGHSLEDICYCSIDFEGLTRVANYDEKYKNVHIDIFILDYAKKHTILNYSLLRKLNSFLYISKLSKQEKGYLYELFKGQPMKQFVLFLSKIAKVVLGGSKRIEKFIFKLRVSTIPTNNYVVGVNFEELPVSYFHPSVRLPYNDSNFMCPAHPEKILTVEYGDYMKYPKEGIKWMEEEKNGINL